MTIRPTKTDRITVRFHPLERRILEDVAEAAHVTLSEWLRTASLGAARAVIRGAGPHGVGQE